MKIYREVERYRQFRNALCGDFSGGSVAKNAPPVQGAQVPSLVRELDPTCHNQDPEQPNIYIHIHTHTHTHIYIYIYIFLGNVLCGNTHCLT